MNRGTKRRPARRREKSRGDPGRVPRHAHGTAEYFIVRKMNPIAKTSLTSMPKSDTPHLRKEHEVDSSSTITANPVLTPRDKSALTIQKAWISYTNKVVFQLLKHTVCAAEFYVTHEILKKVSPSEAELIKDRSMKHKVRFRFSGETFPPYIVFKIFLHTEGHGYKYFSGKNLLKSSIEAASDVYRLVGKKKFFNQIMEDERLNQKFKISDVIDVITIRDYMQYSSLLDEIPASSGGRNNYWRKLTLENIPRATLMYDIVDFVQSGVLSARLRKEIKYLSQRPKTEEMRQHQLRIVSEVRHSSSLARVQTLSWSQQQAQVKPLRRPGKKAEAKSEKMKNTSKMAKEKNAPAETEQQAKTPKTKKQRKVVFSTPSFDIVKINELSSDDEMEKEEKLFSWCQDMYISD
ncbi:PREDICTED: putative uncharacterized protein CXorf58 homolog [Condylura cristata]|uniref:putative uncharacterized protein CXorf58 homolog n=1 Tax=Condylura cristata TaxID=143302 RepID=UPI0006437B93|nr:PREDICTED: putative uncharacterized protein CXorf58 homolog [Condylura cristata]